MPRSRCVGLKLGYLMLGCSILLIEATGPHAAHAQTATSPSQPFQAGVDEAVRELANDPKLKDVPTDKRRPLIEFVAGNMLFVYLHEMGHALVTEMQLPVLGREEDAVDAFAAVTLLKLGSAVSHRVLVEAALGWYFDDLRNQKEGFKQAFYDAHSFDKQRAYQIVCLMVGSDPESFQDLADKAQLPRDRQETCMGDYSNASWSWNKALEPHRRAPDQPKMKIAVVYGDGKGQFDVPKRASQAIRLLEIVAERAADQYVWRRPLTVQIQSCGFVNSEWNVATQKLTLCYEMVQDFAYLYRDYGQTQNAARKVD
jgi:hypothetical protein